MMVLRNQSSPHLIGEEIDEIPDSASNPSEINPTEIQPLPEQTQEDPKTQSLIDETHLLNVLVENDGDGLTCPYPPHST